MSFSEAPEKYYFALRQEHMVVEADATMQAIMEKLQVYRNRLTILFEVGSLPFLSSPFLLSPYTTCQPASKKHLEMLTSESLFCPGVSIRIGRLPHQGRQGSSCDYREFAWHRLRGLSHFVFSFLIFSFFGSVFLLINFAQL